MQKLFSISLLNFLIASVLGVIMRYAFVGDIEPLSYKHLLHAHSHLAMMGWIFMALIILSVHTFVKGGFTENPAFLRLFWLNQFTVVLMTLSFIIQGYGLISIILSSTHLLISYVFVRHIWNYLDFQLPSDRLMRFALLWLLFSTLGLWFLPVFILTLGRNSEFYFMSVQYFLHFQFNGWFLFAILGLFFKHWNELGCTADSGKFKLFFYSLIVSCLLTYTLAVTWSNPKDILFFTNSLGVGLQLISLYFLIRIISDHWEQFNYGGNLYVRGALIIAFISLILKIIIQAAVVVPFVAVISYTIRQFVIGFIHLTLLGAISGVVISIAIKEHILSIKPTTTRIGLSVLTSGILGSEILLFVQGCMLWYERGYFTLYYNGLFGLSLLMPAGIALIVFGNMSYDTVNEMVIPKVKKLQLPEIFKSHNKKIHL